MSFEFCHDITIFKMAIFDNVGKLYPNISSTSSRVFRWFTAFLAYKYVVGQCQGQPFSRSNSSSRLALCQRILIFGLKMFIFDEFWQPNLSRRIMGSYKWVDRCDHWYLFFIIQNSIDINSNNYVYTMLSEVHTTLRSPRE